MVFAIIALFLFPLGVLVFRSGDLTSPFDHDFYRVFTQTTEQAVFSSFGSLLLGFFGGLGLLSISNAKFRRIAEIYVMLPNLLPTLFVIVATLNLVTAVFQFPFGLVGVVIVHVIMNVGLVSVVCARLIENSMGNMIELATIEGAAKSHLLWHVALGLKRELSLLAFVIFTFAFASFSVPLIIGADRGETLEVLIYRAVMAQGNLGYALGLSFVQLTVLAVFSFLVRKATNINISGTRNLARVRMPFAAVALIGLMTALLLANLNGLNQGLTEFFRNDELRSRLWPQAVGTFIECVCVAVMVLVFLLAVAWKYPNVLLERFLLGYSAPSVVITGLGLYLLFDSQTASPYLVWPWLAFGFTLTILPSLYRLKAATTLANLEGQILSARVLGASRGAIFKDILFPQVRREFFFLAGVGALWASGDFGLASLIAGREITLAISAQNLLGGYRVELATVLTWFSLLVGLVVFLIFEVQGRVVYQKSRS